MPSHGPQTMRAPFSARAAAGGVSMVSEDLPEPLTPVTGEGAERELVTSARLLALAPFTVTNLPVPLRRFFGSGISRRPLR